MHLAWDARNKVVNLWAQPVLLLAGMWSHTHTRTLCVKWHFRANWKNQKGNTQEITYALSLIINTQRNIFGFTYELCVINANQLRMSNAKQFLCHMTFLFYYALTHTHISQPVFSRSFIFQMRKLFFRAAGKNSKKPVNFCVSIFPHIHTHAAHSSKCELREFI